MNATAPSPRHRPPLPALAVLLAGLVAAGGCGGDATVGTTPLDEYVAAPDRAYALEQPAAAESDLGTAVARSYRLTSQEWLTTAEVDRPRWEHWLTIYEPSQVATTTALLVMSGGKNDEVVPEVDAKLAEAAGMANALVVELRQIPNQPLRFVAADGSGYVDDGRREDGLIAFAWDRFLETGEPRWLPQLPMAKAAVRAMDAAQTLHPEVTGFFVLGASKRGWTTWLAAAVDDRVVGITPLVINVLNLVPSLANHYADYGFWAPAVVPYVAMDVMARLDTPEFAALAAVIDPYSYRERLTLPKYLINSTGDEFFTPDSWELYWDGLEGEKYLRYVPNTDHGLSDEVYYFDALSFYQAVVTGTPRPSFDWRREADGALSVTCATTPTAVTVWRAANPDARDFRLESIGAAWAAAPLAPDADGVYRAPAAPPASGWAAHFIELEFPNPSFSRPFTFTTGVSVVPDTRPFAKGGSR